MGSATDGLVLCDGRTITIRPLQIADRERLLELFAQLSPESRRRRFLTPKPSLTEREVNFLVDVDHQRHEALAAVDDGDGSIVGVARYVQFRDDPPVAEAAFAVVDRLQMMGIGTALGTRLVRREREAGLSAIVATTLWENQPARALMRRFGFRPRGGQRGEIDLELPLVGAST